MARGNNGNLLQHGVESALARLLTDGSLTVLLGHGMRPFEPFREKRGSSYKLLDRVLERAARATSAADLATVVECAYRSVRASQLYYPNSLELLAALLNSTSLVGAVAETQRAAFADLARRWQDTEMSVFKGSWRQLFPTFQPLDSSPWLVSLDPYTYVPESSADDGNFHKSDWGILKELLRRLPEAHGGVLVFGYELKKQRDGLPGGGTYESFQADGAAWAQSVKIGFNVVEIPATGGNWHLALVFTRPEKLGRQVAAEFAKLLAPG